jgi:hypothetical protein
LAAGAPFEAPIGYRNEPAIENGRDVSEDLLRREQGRIEAEPGPR